MLVIGDAHADDPDNRAALLAAYRASGADTAIQVGDLLWYDLPAQTWFVAGNNEELDVIDELRRGGAPADAANVHLLASSVAEVDGIRVAGLSGNFAPTQYDRPRSALDADRRRHFVRDDVERAARLDDVDVLLTHEAPHGLLSFGYDPGCDPVDELVDTLSPSLHLVGHFHRHVETTRSSTRVVSLAPVWDGYYVLDTDTFELERRESPDA